MVYLSTIHTNNGDLETPRETTQWLQILPTKCYSLPIKPSFQDKLKEIAEKSDEIYGIQNDISKSRTGVWHQVSIQIMLMKFIGCCHAVYK